MNSLFASTARGLEELLKSELTALGAHACKIVQGGVHYQGDERLLYKSLLWSRLASRIFLPLSEFRIQSDLDLYLGVMAIDWPAIFSVNSTFAINFSGVNTEIRNSQYGALKVKDAIVDCFTRKLNQRPNVAKQQPDIRINVFLQRDTVMISLDLSGESLHRRGYRSLIGPAAIKENLAAAIVQRSGWQLDTPLLDPMCGSGVLLIEAALLAADKAPGLLRKFWGFTAWLGYNPQLWRELISEATARAERGLQQTTSRFFGSDIDANIIDIARINASKAGVADLISFNAADVATLVNPLPAGVLGTVISNPPYGERLASEPALIALYNRLGRVLKKEFNGWQVSLFSASPELLSCLQLRAERQFKAKNGPLDCVQKNYRLSEIVQPESASLVAEDFANRLRKNIKKLAGWAKQQGIECYRLYDADLPEYNVAIDRYGDYVVVQEYAPPKQVDVNKARQRLFDIIDKVLAVLKLPPDHLVLKTRERQKGKSQYEKLAQKGEFLQVKEYQAKLWVNLNDYLDTGLFLDHRLVRHMISDITKEKDFLNLFAYTGSASVHAGLGGARTTTTVDMSRTYLEWAEKNLQLNGLTGRRHRLIQADCLKWLQESQEQFDVIFIDPPTFSNSKRMESVFEVQRDHVMLLKALKRLLRTQGVIIFSNNKRNFKMDLASLTALGLEIRDITAKTISPDFSRNRQIHNCWLINHAGEGK